MVRNKSNIAGRIMYLFMVDAVKAEFIKINLNGGGCWRAVPRNG